MLTRKSWSSLLRRLRIAVVACTLLGVLGCSGRLPRVKPPTIDVQSAAEGALAEFDVDGDGLVSQDEACMGVRDQWERYDQDADGSISGEEFATRFREWTDGDTGMMNLRVQLTYRKQPVPDATITMTPFSFLGSNMLASTGVTDVYGYAFMAIPKENLPASQQTAFGMQVGLYKVTVVHPSLKTEKYNVYNAESTLSVDLSPNEANTGVVFHLK